MTAREKKGKNMKKALTFAAIAAVAIGMTGCITHPGVIMDKSKPIEQGGYSVVADTVSSTMWVTSIFGIPLPPAFDDNFGASDLAANAVDAAPARTLYKKALKKAPTSDALIEYALDTQVLNCYLFTVGRYTLTGTAVKTTKK